MITRRKIVIGIVVSKYKLCFSIDKKKMQVLKTVGLISTK